MMIKFIVNVFFSAYLFSDDNSVGKPTSFFISLQILPPFTISSSNKYSGVEMKNPYVPNDFPTPNLFPI